MADVVTTTDAPMAVGPYSQGVVVGNLVFTAGEIPVDPATGEIPATIEEQTALALSNMWAVLKAAGVKENGAVSVTVYLTDIADFAKVNLVYADHFTKPFPARTCVQVAALPKNVKIMVSAVGAIE